MTDREPDNLYDALRDRLADYGQEPPAPLWAGIRAQLPPPVALPQRPPRARRRWLAALALLLLTGLSTWYWWPQGRPGTDAVARAAARAGGRGPAATVAAGPAHQPSAAATPARPGAARPAGPAAQALAALAPTRQATGTPTSSGAGAAKPLAATPPVTSPAASGARASSAAGAAAAAPTGAKHLWTAARPWGHPQPPTAGRPRPDAAAFVATTASEPAAVRTAPRAPALAAAPTVGGSNDTATAAHAARPATTGASAAGLVAAAGPQLPLADEARLPLADEARPASETWLQALPRAAALQLPTSTLPGRLARADTLAPRPLATGRRWAVQWLAGPALTASVAGQRASASPVIIASLPGNQNLRPVLNRTDSDEQAAVGFGAEGQLQRQLNGRWSLGTGLGYHAFATTQTVQVRTTYELGNVLRPDSVSNTTVRNTYHFLTLPLRVGYQLGSGRLRYGLRAGAGVALYLGGRSAGSGTATSISRSWGASGSPYHSLSLALSLGAEVRYRLAPGWELLAQPTLTHFATSVARPVSGLGPRYPLAASALVGVACWLR